MPSSALALRPAIAAGAMHRPAEPAAPHPSGGGYRPARSGRMLGIGGAMIAHALLIAAFFWVQRFPPVTASPAASRAIRFEMAPLPSAPPARPVDVPPGPAQQEQTPAPARATGDAAPPPETPAPAVPAPADGVPSSDARPVERTTAPPAAAAPGPAPAASRNAVASEQSARADWRSALLGHLKPFLRFPRQAERAGQRGVAIVAVTVDRRGTVLAARIRRGSGYPLLDAEAVATVRRGSPVPPPGADIPGDPVVVEIPIQFALRR